MNPDKKNRMAVILPLAVLLAFADGCGPKAEDTSSTPAPATSSPAPAATAPSGPMSPMMDKTGLKGTGAGDNKTVGEPLTTMKIKNALLADTTIGATGINVSTSANGQVSLTGNVKDQAAKDKAEQVAKGTKGVIKVVNDLKIMP